MINKHIIPAWLRKIAKASAVLTSATVVSSLCSFIALGLNARALGVEQLGFLALMQAYVSFISGLTTFDNWQPVVRLGIRSPKKIGLIIGAGIILDLIASLAATSIAIIGLLVFSLPRNFGEVFTLPLLVYCLSLLAGVGGTPKGYFRLTGRFNVLAQNQIINGLIQVVCSVALWLLDASLVTYLFIFGLLSVFPGLLLLFRMLFALNRGGIMIVNPVKVQSHRRYFWLFLRLASGNSIMSSLVTSRYQIALFIVSAVLGSVATGLFAVASRCANAFARFAVPLNQVIFPEIMRYANDRSAACVRNMLRRITIYSATGSLVLMVIGVFAGELIITIATGKEFASAAGLFSLLFAGEAILWAGFHFNPIILKSSGQRPLLILNLTITALTALTSLLLAHATGQTGVAAAMVLGAVCTFTAQYLLAERVIAKAVERGGRQSCTVD